MKKRVRKNKFSLKSQYIKSWNYIKDSRNFIYTVIILFFIFAFIGFFAPVPEEISKEIMDYIKKILEEIKDFGRFEMIKFIFLNNIQSSFASIIFGFLLGILPFLAAIFNGYLIGFVASMAVDQAGVSSLLNLLPHGIFELPAIFISLGLGLKFGSFLFKKNKSESFKEYFFEGLRVFVFIVLPLLIIAAIIEGSLMF
jgi:stage II sporulation protein M